MTPATTRFLVLADDRTGAFETAGALATAALPTVLIAPHPRPGGALQSESPGVVWDLATRHLAPLEAAATVSDAVGAAGEGAHGHKIDSTLRGVWAHELVARHRANGQRVLVVPAFPAAGRTCEGGVVRVDGRPVDAALDDARGGPASARPADHLAAAGADDVAELLDARALGSWCRHGGAFAVMDARVDDDLRYAATAWVEAPDLVLAGTAAALGAGAAVLTNDAPAPDVPALEGPVLVVCGSLHAAARAQLAALAASGAPIVATAEDAVAALATAPVVVVATAEPATRIVAAAEAVEQAERLAASARTVLAATSVGTVLVVGGDTAAAVLGPDPIVVGGTLTPGVPWGRWAGGGPLLVTKPGGFGDADVLVRLLSGTMPR